MHISCVSEILSIVCAVCGPNALKSGVANAVASLQKLVIHGQIQNIALDSETFGNKFMFRFLIHKRANSKAGW